VALQLIQALSREPVEELTVCYFSTGAGNCSEVLVSRATTAVHRITEWFGLEGTLKIAYSQPGCRCSWPQAGPQQKLCSVDHRFLPQSH